MTDLSAKLKVFAFVLAIVILNAFGNLALAFGMRRLAEPVSIHPLAYLRAMLNPFVDLGIALLILWLLARMALLSWADLTFVMPLTGIGYVLTVAFAKFFLKESVSAGHWIGTLLIVAGTSMVGSTEHRTEASHQALAHGAVP